METNAKITDPSAHRWISGGSQIEKKKIEEGRGKSEEGRGKREEGRGKRILQPAATPDPTYIAQQGDRTTRRRGLLDFFFLFLASGARARMEVRLVGITS